MSCHMPSRHCLLDIVNNFVHAMSNTKIWAELAATIGQGIIVRNQLTIYRNLAHIGADAFKQSLCESRLDFVVHNVDKEANEIAHIDDHNKMTSNHLTIHLIAL